MQEAEQQQDTTRAEEAAGSGRALLLKKLRLPLVIVGGVLAAIVFLLIGIWIGSAKRSSDIKQYEERIATAKKQAESAVSEQKVLEVKLEGISGSMKMLKESEESKNQLIARMQEKLECFEQAAAQALAAEQTTTQTAAAKPGARTKSESPPKGYVRFGNSSCTLVAGGSSSNWKECLKQGKPVGSAEKKAAPAAESGEKPGEAAVKGAVKGH